MSNHKPLLLGFMLLLLQGWAPSSARAQDNPTVLDDLVFVMEQSYNRDQVRTAMQQFHASTGVGLAITTVYDNGIYTSSARDTQAEWLQRELGISLFITLDQDKGYLRCEMQVTPAVALLLPLEDQQRIQREFMEYYFLGDFTTDDACTQGLLVGIAAMEERILERKAGEVDSVDKKSDIAQSGTEEKEITGLDSLIYEIIVQRITESEAMTDSLKEAMQPFIEELEGIIERENFYPPRIRGANDELIGEGISLHIAIVDKPKIVQERLSQAVKAIDKNRNNLIALDIPIQELKPAIEVLSTLKEDEPFQELVESIRQDSHLPEATAEKIPYIKELLDQRISEHEE